MGMSLKQVCVCMCVHRCARVYIIWSQVDCTAHCQHVLSVFAHRYKSTAMAARAIRHSHPVTSTPSLVGWIDHILPTGGGAHLKPHAFQPPWHVQNLLDVLLVSVGVHCRHLVAI